MVTNRIIHGDSIKAMKALPQREARLVIADPPYFNVQLKETWDTQWKTEDDYLKWTATWITAAMNLLMPGGLLYCFGQIGKREQVFLHVMANTACHHHDLIIWDRAVGYNDRIDSFTPAYEMICVLRKDGEVYFNKDAVREKYSRRTIDMYAKDSRYKDPEARMTHLNKGKKATNLWRIPSLKGSSKEKVGHPTQKPEEVMRRIILSSTDEGDLVIDPFVGSGTSAVVAQELGRQWIGIDADKSYVEMAQERIRNRATVAPTPNMTIVTRNPNDAITRRQLRNRVA